MENNNIDIAQRVIDITSDIDKSLKYLLVDSNSPLSSSFKSVFEMIKSPEEYSRIVRHICRVLVSSDPSSIPPPPPAAASACASFSTHPPHDDDEGKKNEDMVKNLLQEIHQTHKALSHLRLVQDDDSLSFFDIWRKSSEAERKAMTNKIVHVTKQKKRKRDEEEAKRQEREAKEAIDLKWLLQACDCGEIKASELLSLMYLDPTVTEGLIHKFCIEVVKSGKCDRVDRVVIVDNCKSES